MKCLLYIYELCYNICSPIVAPKGDHMLLTEALIKDTEFNPTKRITLTDGGIEPSVGSVGDSYDNALAETINGLYKAEVIHRLGPWKTMAAVEWETLKWVDWFNNRRLLAPIGYIPPSEAEERYYAQFNTLDMVA